VKRKWGKKEREMSDVKVEIETNNHKWEMGLITGMRGNGKRKELKKVPRPRS
jgi:hypothetical protein